MKLGGGGLNAVTRAVLEEFRPRFFPQSRLVWVTENSETACHICEEGLAALQLEFAPRHQFPNIVLHDVMCGLVVLIDVAGIRGPMNASRRKRLKEILGGRGPGLILVSAFESRQELQILLREIPWGTSAWFADEPRHMIHFGVAPFLPVRSESGCNGQAAPA